MNLQLLILIAVRHRVENGRNRGRVLGIRHRAGVLAVQPLVVRGKSRQRHLRSLRPDLRETAFVERHASQVEGPQCSQFIRVRLILAAQQRQGPINYGRLL